MCNQQVEDEQIRLAVHHAIAFANEYKDKTITDYASDNEMTNEQAEKLIEYGMELMR